MSQNKTPFFTTVRLGGIAAFGVIAIIVNLALSTPIVMITGILAAGGVVMLIAMPLLVVMGCFIFRRFGAITLGALVFGILALPFPILGPAGFAPKLILTTIPALAADAVIALLGSKEKLAAIISSVVLGLLAVGSQLILFKFFLPDALEPLLPLVPVLIIVAVIGGMIGGLLGWKIYDAIRNRSVVHRLQT